MGTAITGLPKMDGCSSLTDLSLGSCRKLTAEGLAEFFAQPPSKLQKLKLSWCELLKTLPPSIGDCTSLMSLELHNCSSLEAVPDSISKLQNLKDLNLRST